MGQIVILHGHVGATQELQRRGKNDTPVINFTLGVNDFSAPEGKDTTWFKCAQWGTHAENIAQYIVPGKELIIQGRLQPDGNGNPNVYQKKDGDWGASFELTVDRLEFCGKRGDVVESSSAPLFDEEDEIPF